MKYVCRTVSKTFFAGSRIIGRMKKCAVLSLGGLVALLVSLPTFAVTLQWDAVPAAESYTVLFGASSKAYTVKVPVAKVTSYAYTAKPAGFPDVYYAAVVSNATAPARESAPSNEVVVSHVVPDAPVVWSSPPPVCAPTVICPVCAICPGPKYSVKPNTAALDNTRPLYTDATHTKALVVNAKAARIAAGLPCEPEIVSGTEWHWATNAAGQRGTTICVRE